MDKTKHVYDLLTENRRTFLSRPRRFGKSLLVSTLEAALQGKRELFKGLWIDQSDYDWEPFGVIRLDFSELSVESKGEFKQSLVGSLMDIAKSYDIILKEETNLNLVFKKLIVELASKFTKKSIAVLIDEYDYPILHTLHKPKIALQIRSVLKSFSAVIKAQSALVQFVFVTGVSAFSKLGLSSGLNNLKNLTMGKQFFAICGYTDIEVEIYFKEHIESFAALQKVSYKEIKEDLKKWYNGYRFEENALTIYSPFSLTCSLDIKKLQNFWFESATRSFF